MPPTIQPDRIEKTYAVIRQRLRLTPIVGVDGAGIGLPSVP